MIFFRAPFWLLLLLLLPLFIWYYFAVYLKNKSALHYSSLLLVKSIKPSWKVRLQHFPFILQMLLIALTIIVLAGPRFGKEKKIIEKKAIDIMVALDLSQSMSAEDMSPNRLEIAKETTIEFIQKRAGDRIGFLIFGKEALLQVPLTFDHDLLAKRIDELAFIEGFSTSTAIGDAIGTVVNFLKNSKAKSKIIILITDGVNNAGQIDPKIAAELAVTYGIKVYTIGIGQPGVSEAFVTLDDPVLGKRKRKVKVVMDEDTLLEVASITSGRYFNVQNIDEFSKTYAEINQLEKTLLKSQILVDYKEYYLLILYLIALVFTLQAIIELLVLRRNTN